MQGQIELPNMTSENLTLHESVFESKHFLLVSQESH